MELSSKVQGVQDAGEMAYEDKMAFMTDKRCHWRYLEDEPR
ncbi:hypothetical protein F441_13323 [Phytophthora nicotianae CJ01A1]|uniref:Uncharacterized protein n=6 Tax=Phytophthora nicotianae TaxID=4792 RepID=W2R4T8_PHYN3|nr:hypothetical protein PPTG_21282 [Phytophthora nicotianae INRA-310]ETI41377.1 hypothetical protein F443_13384 [Phytophthora nicotianae P1569]ETK81427.1 hypothetical protein L915_13076 [Phytophthora nicotianae]ETO70037.1 hypothetical protein F444_13455 [Phytophthora nicotianae P1976]ETP11142.1 hypothetical protein F441_13323 [Phytophthora nicotianae CJ01A1]ETP28420.1 hypothetical protein F442_22285 [Phytophthora nicotianae P10297]